VESSLEELLTRWPGLKDRGLNKNSLERDHRNLSGGGYWLRAHYSGFSAEKLVLPVPLKEKSYSAHDNLMSRRGSHGDLENRPKPSAAITLTTLGGPTFSKQK